MICKKALRTRLPFLQASNTHFRTVLILGAKTQVQSITPRQPPANPPTHHLPAQKTLRSQRKTEEYSHTTYTLQKPTHPSKPTINLALRASKSQIQLRPSTSSLTPSAHTSPHPHTPPIPNLQPHSSSHAYPPHIRNQKSARYNKREFNLSVPSTT